MYIYKLFFQFYRSLIGKKVIVALTGLVMVAWLLGHMLGNLQIFAGRGASPETTLINQYAQMLHDNVALLWIVRLVMLKMIVLHVTTTIQLVRRNKHARPQGYYKKQNVESSFASRSMVFGGLFIFAYIIYHIMHFTVGRVHAEQLIQGDLYSSMINSFQVPAISMVYLLGQLALFFHLFHGVQSTTRTFGVSHPKYIRITTIVGATLASIITIGFASIPIAVLTGVID